MNQSWNNLIENIEQISSTYGLLGSLLFIILSTIIVNRFIRSFLRKVSTKSTVERNLYLNTIVYAIKKPLTILIWVNGFFFTTVIIEKFFTFQAISGDNLKFSFKIVLLSLFLWAIFRFINRAEQNAVNPQYNKRPTNKTTALAVSRLSKISVFIFGALLYAQTLNIELTGIVTLGSAGTLVLGIAARDLLANFFGGLMIFTDRPFSVGDWIRSNEKDIEGTVEYIGWRLTRILTFDKRPLYVPNSLFLTIGIENPSRMRNRRIKEIISLRYKDVMKIAKIVEEVENYLNNNKDIDQNATLFVALNHFNASSADLQLYCFTRTTEWVPYLKAQQDVFLKISEIIQKHGADMAFPTTTLDIPQQAFELGKE